MFLLNYFKEILITIGLIFIGFFYKKMKTLDSENKSLAESNSEKDKVLRIQQKVLDVNENIEHADLDDNLKRLSNKNK